MTEKNQDEKRFALHRLGFEESEKFQRSLGELFLTWADTEMWIYRILLHYAGISEAVGRALFSGTRAKPLMDMVRNVAINTNIDKSRRDNLDFVFSQIAGIGTMRDMLAHYGSTSYTWADTFTPQERWLTNAFRVNKYEKTKMYIIGSAHLVAMLGDLRKAMVYLERHTKKGLTSAAFDERPTWLYKSLQPEDFVARMSRRDQ